MSKYWCFWYLGGDNHFSSRAGRPNYFLPRAFLLLTSCSSFASSRCSPVPPSCCLPAAFLWLACHLPCRFPVASLLPNLLPCRYPVACLLLAGRRPVASLLSPVASLLPNVLPCRSPAALFVVCCCCSVGCLSPTCRFPVAFLSPACRLFCSFWSEEKRNLVAVEMFSFCFVFHHLWALKHLHYCYLTL